MEPITVAQLAMLLVVGFLLFRTQSGPPSHRGWRGFRRDPSIFPVMLEARARRRQAEWRAALEQPAVLVHPRRGPDRRRAGLVAHPLTSSLGAARAPTEGPSINRL